MTEAVCCPEFNRPGDCIGLCVNEPGQLTIQDARAKAAERFGVDSPEFDAEVERLRYVEPFCVRRDRVVAQAAADGSLWTRLKRFLSG